MEGDAPHFVPPSQRSKLTHILCSSSRSGGPRMATLSDLNSSGQSARAPASSDEDDDDDDDENGDGESWFTGGERR